MNLQELLEEIQTWLNEQRETSDEEQEDQRLLAEFYQVPSYVERLKRDPDNL